MYGDSAKEKQRHHCYTTPFEMINEIYGRERRASPVLFWRCKYLVVSCFIKFLKYLLNTGLFLVIHYNVISPHFYGDSWSHINSFSLGGSSIGKVWFLFVIPLSLIIRLMGGCYRCCGIVACLGCDMWIFCIFFVFVQMENLNHNGRKVMSPEMDSTIFLIQKWAVIWYYLRTGNVMGGK